MNQQSPMYGVIDLPRFIADPPRLWAWGDILDLPKREIIKLVVNLADLLPPTIDRQGVDVFEKDMLLNAIGYTLDDFPTHVDRNELLWKGDNEFDALVIEAAVTLRQVLGHEVRECHFVDVRHSRYLFLEWYHAPDYHTH